MNTFQKNILTFGDDCFSLEDVCRIINVSKMLNYNEKKELFFNIHANKYFDENFNKVLSTFLKNNLNIEIQKNVIKITEVPQKFLDSDAQERFIKYDDENENERIVIKEQEDDYVILNFFKKSTLNEEYNNEIYHDIITIKEQGKDDIILDSYWTYERYDDGYIWVRGNEGKPDFERYQNTIYTNNPNKPFYLEKLNYFLSLDSEGGWNDWTNITRAKNLYSFLNINNPNI